jgi:flagella basal body P-ring formation protein FlgA
MIHRKMLPDCSRASRTTGLRRPWCRAVLTAIGVALLGPGAAFGPVAARAAELQLRAECRCLRPIVRLGDVADVVAADARQADALAAVELFPAPPPGAKRFLSPREIQDSLLLRGIHPLDHRLSGSSRVVIFGVEGPGETGEARLAASTIRKTDRRISEAIVEYLQERVSSTESWSVDVTLDETQARLVAGGGSDVAVRGGTPPWVGLQRFEVTVGSPEGPKRFVLDAEVTLPPAVVVATCSLPRGAMIRAADVRLEKGEAPAGQAAVFHSMEEVVGRETTRAIPEGKVLDANSIRQPLLVRRGDVVTVYARSAGVCVRSTARAREDGSLGDLVTVESLLDRATYFAQVSGIREVEVYARATRADSATLRSVAR